jgi:hypothetical protein
MARAKERTRACRSALDMHLGLRGSAHSFIWLCLYLPYAAVTYPTTLRYSPTAPGGPALERRALETWLVRGGGASGKHKALHQHVQQDAPGLKFPRPSLSNVFRASTDEWHHADSSACLLITMRHTHVRDNVMLGLLAVFLWFAYSPVPSLTLKKCDEVR